MTISEIKKQNCLLFESISGSRAYGTDLPGSDTDIKGVFVLPKKMFLGLDYIPQISDEKNDVVYYEIGRFVELLSKNNPNILEMLASPDECILYKNVLFDKIKMEWVLSKLCKDTFAGYAQTQIKKARGLNKKILNPIDKKRKGVLDFCYVLADNGSVSLLNWLKLKNIQQEDCGLVNIPHIKSLYGLYHNPDAGYKGITQKTNANDVQVSSVLPQQKVSSYLSFNKDAYSTYCKQYKAYWDWVEKRNDLRYKNTLSHGKNYDSKNMMHTFRLLDMAYEIATEQAVKVRRANREELLQIRAGAFDYETLLEKAEHKLLQIEKAYQKCLLPNEPDKLKLKSILVDIRTAWYDG